MGIKVSCPHCDQSYTLAETQEGKTVRCKHCEETFVVSQGRPSRREQDEEEEEERPRRRSSSRYREDQEDEDDRPRRKTKGRVVPLWALLAGGGGLLLILILVVVVVANKGNKSDKTDKSDNSGRPPVSAAINSGSRGNEGSRPTGGTGGLTLDNFRKLRAGMSEAEVEAIFGPPTKTIIPGNPQWYTRNARQQPVLNLGIRFTDGKLEQADLSSYTYSGDHFSRTILGQVDSRGVRIPNR